MTQNQLKEKARANLIPFLKENDFELVSGLTFVRNRPEEIKDVISLLISHRENLTVFVTCYTSEMDEDDIEIYRFPKGLPTMVGGELDPDREIQRSNSYLWKIGTNDDTKIALNSIQEALIHRAFPFFDKIDSRKELIDAIHPRLRDAYKEKVERILGWEKKQ
ncbi:hypothetical protein [Gallaecimonas sp. GXIMD4217]|uniref:hypothetical protein n=1 Tax=Gallaecimonas sp. GXIMD4217 TaxID=3131927 RepID=UPI00311B2920